MKRFKVLVTDEEWESILYAIDFLNDHANGADIKPGKRIMSFSSKLMKLSNRIKRINENNSDFPSQKMIIQKGKEMYHHGSYWSGVKADAFREGAKWMKQLWKKSMSLYNY